MAADKFRILAIDDDKDILDLIHISLDDDYDVITLSESVDACEVIEFCEPDAVIVDIMMPKITGYHIVEHIKECNKLMQTVVIFLSAKDTPRDVKYGYKVGANIYLTKPFQPERLVKTLGMFLSEHGHPRKKTLSLRDISNRLRLKKGLHKMQVPGQGMLLQDDIPMPDIPHMPSATVEPEVPKEGEESSEAKWVG